MQNRLRLATLLGLAVLILPANGRPADDDSSQAQPLTSGPVHEAFAQPGSASLEQPPAVNRAPPAPLSEEVPDEKPEGDNVQWIGGYWDYAPEQKDFVWVTGIWRIPPPDHQWAPTYWSENNARWQRTPGFWSPFSGEMEQQELTYFPKPPAEEEEDPGQAPDAESDFAPGSWDSDGGNGFTWRPGRWIRRHPGWRWRPAIFFWTRKGWIRQAPFWDLALSRRGVPFAPLRVPSRLRGPGKFRFRPIHAISAANLSKSLLRNPGGRGFRLKGAQLTRINKIPGVKTVRVSPQHRAALTKLANDLRKLGQHRRQRETFGVKHPVKTPVRDRFVMPKPRLAKGGDKKFTPPPHPKSIRLAKKTSGTTKKPTHGGRVAGPKTKKPGLIAPGRKPGLHKPVAKKPTAKTTASKKQLVKKKPTGSKSVVKKPARVKKTIRPTAMRKTVRSAVKKPPVRSAVKKKPPRKPVSIKKRVRKP